MAVEVIVSSLYRDCCRMIHVDTVNLEGVIHCCFPCAVTVTGSVCLSVLLAELFKTFYAELSEMFLLSLTVH